MKRFFVTLTIIVLFGAGLSITTAQPKEKSGMGKAKMMEKLNLTDEQLESLNEFRFAHQEKAIDLRASMEKNRLELKKLMSADIIDQTKIMELTKTNNNIRAEIQESRMQMWLDTYNLLDDSQKKIYKNGMQHGMGNGMMGMGRHNAPGQHERGMGRKGGMHEGRGMNHDHWRN